MYILIPENVPPGNAIVAAAHAPMVCERRFGDTDNFKRWKVESFKKVVCRLNESEIAPAREAGDFAVVTESSLGDAVVALVFCPREEFPKAFRFFKLWR